MAGRSRDGRSVRKFTVCLVYLLTLLGSYCQMAPAVAGAIRAWETGRGHKYKLSNTLIFREAAPWKSGGDVGFRLTGVLDITAVWRNPGDLDTYLLKFELSSLQLWIRSRRAPEPEGFVEHSSKVGQAAEKPFLVLWRYGDVQAIYMDQSETVSSANLKRGLASLFQYRTLDDEHARQRDASGLCDVVYTSLGPQVVQKRKADCTHNSFPWRKRHPNPLLDVTVEHVRNSTYKLTQSLLPETIVDYETHRVTLTTRSEIGSAVLSESALEQTPDVLSAKSVQAESAKHAVALVQPGFREVDIEVQAERSVCPDSGCPTVEQTIEEHRKALEVASLGTAKSASAFLKLLPLVKEAPFEELYKILKAPRHRQLRMQLLDVYGAASTSAAHEAAMRVLQQDETGDETERYLWALSFSPMPTADVAADLLRRSEETMQNDKVSETYALAAASMTRHYGSPVMIEKARASLELGLNTCTGDECRLKFLRALRNLQSPAAIPTLLAYAFSTTRAISVAAWRALAALPRESVTSDLKSAAYKMFYQIGGPRRDSSARTLALDIILESDPSEEELRDFVKHLNSQDPAYEVRKYLSQRLEQLAEQNQRFAGYLRNAYATCHTIINNYHTRAQKGLSTAFARSFLRSPNSNGSLVTVHEVSSGLLKRGYVDVILETNQHRQAMFTLGLFVGGLGSFISSQEEAEADDEVATAGMEIDLLGVGVRPFVFFSGQGELMGHVWSGTASERTPAFQVLTSLHSYKEYVPLVSGFVVEIDVEGAVSFDLAGQIQLSLWSKNAQSLVEMGAGVMVHGGTKVHSSFVQSKAEFSMTMEPKLELSTDVDFSGQVALCMKLSQPVTTVKHQIYKIERIPGSRHKLRKARRSRIHSPGRSYMLNRKNNEMCAKFS